MTSKEIEEAMISTDKKVKATKDEAYYKIMGEVQESHISVTSSIIISWALADYFNMSVDVFETKEDW